MKTALLLGAGSSIPAGFPCTRTLTDFILSGRGVKRETDSAYYINSDCADVQDGTTRLVVRMANQVYKEVERYNAHYKMQRQPNYEDLAYVVDQGCEQWSGELDNPIVLSFLENLRSEMASEIQELRNYDHRICGNHAGDDMLASLLEETRNYFVDIVYRCLNQKPTSLSQLDLIQHICENSDLTSISTLCHDTHLETFLADKGIAFADGFSESTEAGIRYWNGNFSSDNKLSYLKLHGSIDWFELHPQGGNLYSTRIGCVPSNLNLRYLETMNGGWLNSTGRPILLIGTFNKLSKYSSGIFGDIHCCFRSTVRNADQLVICGYSFGDKGINSEIVDWICGDRKRRLIVIHREPSILLANARPAIRNNWSEWEKHGSVLVMEKHLECINMSDLSVLN